MAEMPHADLLRGELTGALQKDVETLKTIFGLPENADIVFRPFEAGGFSLCAVYTEGMAKDDKVADFILRAYMRTAEHIRTRLCALQSR